MNLPEKIKEKMELLDSTTYNHSIRVWKLALSVEEYYRMADDSLSTAALVHDIGKLYISPAILDKHEGFTELERELVDLHPYIGYRMLKECNVSEVVRRIVLYHHGRNPRLLSPLPEFYSSMVESKAKMLKTIDAFEALTTDRPYRRRMSVKQAAAFLREQEGYHRQVLRYLRENIHDFDHLSDAGR